MVPPLSLHDSKTFWITTWTAKHKHHKLLAHLCNYMTNLHLILSQFVHLMPIAQSSCGSICVMLGNGWRPLDNASTMHWVSETSSDWENRKMEWKGKGSTKKGWATRGGKIDVKNSLNHSISLKISYRKGQLVPVKASKPFSRRGSVLDVCRSIVSATWPIPVAAVAYT